jgi:WD40 repeat protein
MNSTETLSPYIWPGLASYQEQDQHLFYGRPGEIFDLTRKILSSRLTILFGPSGAGKTSLLQAGVFPKLREQNYLPVLVRLDFPQANDPITPVVAQFDGALSRECSKSGVRIHYSDNPWISARKDRLSLWEWLRSFSLTDLSGTSCQPVFIFDQFEEIFTLGKNARGLETLIRQIGDAAENFMPEEISQLINEGIAELPFEPAFQPYKTVITLRDDYLAQLQGLRQVLPGVTVRQNHFALNRLTGSQALEAITGPAPAGMISGRVATEIIHFVANSSESADDEQDRSESAPDHLEVEPAILSLVCQQLDLKRRSRGEQSITVDFVKQSRGQILEEFYESAMRPVQQATRSFVEDHLLDTEGFRTSEPESNLLHHQVPLEDISRLIDCRLLHRVEFYHRSHLELSHDVLAPVVRSSRDSRLQREEGVRREAEIRLLRKKRQRSALLSGVFACITVCALVAGFFSIRNQKAAKTEKRKAVSLYLISNSQIMTQKNTDQALCMALLANQIDSSTAATNNIRKIIYDYNSPISKVILKGHRNFLYSAVFSPDGSRVITASRDSTAKLWDTQGNLITDFRGHRGEVYRAVFSKDGQRILTASSDSTARLWDINGNSLSVFKGHHGIVINAIFSPDGTYVLTASRDSTARLWDLDGALVTTFHDMNGWDLYSTANFSSSAIFSPNGEMVLATSLNNAARLWDLKGNILTEFTGHTTRVGSVGFSPDGTRVATTSLDKTAKIWDLQGKLLTDLTGQQPYCWNPTFSHAGAMMLTSSQPDANLWDLSGNVLAEFKGHRNVVYDAVFSPDGQLILTSSDDNTAKIWDLQGNLVSDFKGHQRDVKTAFFSPDGKQIVTSSYDNTAKIWDVGGGLVVDLKAHNGPILYGFLSPEGSRIMTIAMDSTIKVWDLGGKLLYDYKYPVFSVLSIITHPEWVRSLMVFDPAKGQLWGSRDSILIRLNEHRGNVFSVFYSNSFEQLLIRYKDGTARLWDLKENRMVELKSKPGSIYSVAFSSDGKWFLVVGYYRAQLWDSDGNLIAEMSGHTGHIRSAKFSPDGERILTASSDNTAKLWDLQGNLVADFVGHSNSVTSASFSPDGSQVLTTSAENTARLWDLNGNFIVEFIGHQGALSSGFFSPDGQLIATSSQDNMAKVWDLRGNLVIDLKGHLDDVSSILFSPEGNKIFTFSNDGTAKIWPGFDEMMDRIESNVHREKLSLKSLLEIPITLSEREFEKAVGSNIVEGNYEEYRNLVRKESKDKKHK